MSTFHEIIEQGKKAFDEKLPNPLYDEAEIGSPVANDEIKSFLSSFAEKIAEATRDAMLTDGGVSPVEPSKGWNNGWSDARSESLKRYEEFVKKT